MDVFYPSRRGVGVGDGGMVCLEEPGWGERRKASSMFVILNVRQNLKSPATQMFFQYPDVWQGTDHVPSSREALGILSLTSSLQRLLTARSEHPVSSHHPLSGVEFFFSSKSLHMDDKGNQVQVFKSC